MLAPFFVAVEQESAEQTGVEMIEYESEEVLVELEAMRELIGDLPDAVDELEENWRAVIVVVLVYAVADAV